LRGPQSGKGRARGITRGKRRESAGLVKGNRPDTRVAEPSVGEHGPGPIGAKVGREEEEKRGKEDDVVGGHRSRYSFSKRTRKEDSEEKRRCETSPQERAGTPIRSKKNNERGKKEKGGRFAREVR